MTLLVWVVLGLVSGFIVHNTINKRRTGFVLDLILGIVGALVGGGLLNAFGMATVGGLDPDSFLVAIAGAIVLLTLYHFLVRRENYDAFVDKPE